jgi:hypothetical protein
MRTKDKRALRTGRHLGLYLALCLALCLAFAFVSVEAGGIGEAEVRAAVETWVRYVTADARPDAVVERMEPHQVDGETVAYIAHLEGGGFCLSGADDLVLPVYYYSPQGTYDPQNPNYQYILWEIGARLKTLQRGLEEGDARLQPYQEALSKRATFWQELIAGRAPTQTEAPQGTLAEPISMTLPLSSTWHQGTGDPSSPGFNTFNAMCPVLTPIITPTVPERTVVGCVATAMAQIMYYWQWPNTGEGPPESVNYPYWQRNDWAWTSLAVDPVIAPTWPWTGRLDWTATGGGRLRMNGYWDQTLYSGAQSISQDPSYQAALATLWGSLSPKSKTYSADFAVATYDWNIMTDTQAAPGSASNAEMAELSYHAGVAAGMNYGILESATSPANLEIALENHFRYDHDANYAPKNIGQMTEEIQWLRPFHFRGTGPRGGHSWVVFGYNWGTVPVQFKMNMGWGWGYSQPPYGWYSCDNVPEGLTIDQAHTTWIAPLDVVRFVGGGNPGDGSPYDPYEDIEEAIALAPSDATLIFRAGSVNTFSGDTLFINRPFTLKGKDVTIRKE